VPIVIAVVDSVLVSNSTAVFADMFLVRAVRCETAGTLIVAP
jgi:hypothetical protein